MANQKSGLTGGAATGLFDAASSLDTVRSFGNSLWKSLTLRFGSAGFSRAKPRSSGIFLVIDPLGK
jgi:hypothetical protein